MTKLNQSLLPMLSTDKIQEGSKCPSLRKSEWKETCFIMTSLLQYTSYLVFLCSLQMTGHLSVKGHLPVH